MSNFDLQSNVVIEQLIKNGYTMENATKCWYNSKTRNQIITNHLGYVSGMRCYWELSLELSNDSRWMKEPFDM